MVYRNYDQCVALFFEGVSTFSEVGILHSHMNLHGLFVKNHVTGQPKTVALAKILTRVEHNKERYSLNNLDVELLSFLTAKTVPVVLVLEGDKLLLFNHEILDCDTLSLGFYCVRANGAIRATEPNLLSLLNVSNRYAKVRT